MTPGLLKVAATMSAVIPSLLLAFGSAPSLTRAWMTSGLGVTLAATISKEVLSSRTALMDTFSRFSTASSSSAEALRHKSAKSPQVKAKASRTVAPKITAAISITTMGIAALLIKKHLPSSVKIGCAPKIVCSPRGQDVWGKRLPHSGSRSVMNCAGTQPDCPFFVVT